MYYCSASTMRSSYAACRRTKNREQGSEFRGRRLPLRRGHGQRNRLTLHRGSNNNKCFALSLSEQTTDSYDTAAFELIKKKPHTHGTRWHHVRVVVVAPCCRLPKKRQVGVLDVVEAKLTFVRQCSAFQRRCERCVTQACQWQTGASPQIRTESRESAAEPHPGGSIHV